MGGVTGTSSESCLGWVCSSVVGVEGVAFSMFARSLPAGEAGVRSPALNERIAEELVAATLAVVAGSTRPTLMV